ncbi:TRAP transporter small permease [Marinivivus vitaminiproducens]|uniref:TRAP transporter small permease n=1 Tax=Marinivivus vitaminiproducens TaxID=3035935 RepID=UPI00279EC3F7|nr:TRAP transporter small permease subunit [Geminicoccaceae bacterium SCSIO 64248]
MKAIAGIRSAVLTAFEAAALAAFLLMLGCSILQIVFRYVFNMPLMWTEELARLMCVLTTYFGGVVVLIARQHIRVDMIDGYLTGRSAAVLGIVVDLLISWFLVALAYGCFLMTRATWTTFTASMAWFRMGYVYAAVGVAVTAMLLLLVLDIYAQVRTLSGRTGAEA